MTKMGRPTEDPLALQMRGSFYENARRRKKAGRKTAPPEPASKLEPFDIRDFRYCQDAIDFLLDRIRSFENVPSVEAAENLEQQAPMEDLPDSDLFGRYHDYLKIDHSPKMQKLDVACGLAMFQYRNLRQSIALDEMKTRGLQYGWWIDQMIKHPYANYILFQKRKKND
ncbi:hypothetical protein ACFL54_06290 [Planctomycetota bacterium]